MTEEEPDRLAPGHREHQELRTSFGSGFDPRPPWPVNTAGILGIIAAALYGVDALLTPAGTPSPYSQVMTIEPTTIVLGVIFAFLLAATVVALWLTSGKRPGPKLVLAWLFAAACISGGFGLGTVPLVASTIFFAASAKTSYYSPPDPH